MKKKDRPLKYFLRLTTLIRHKKQPLLNRLAIRVGKMRKNVRHSQVPSSDIEKRPKRGINTLDCCQLTAPPTHTINKEFCPQSLHGESIYVTAPTNRNPTQRWHLNFSLLVSLSSILLYFVSLPSIFLFARLLLMCIWCYVVFTHFIVAPNSLPFWRIMTCVNILSQILNSQILQSCCFIAYH